LNKINEIRTELNISHGIVVTRDNDTNLTRGTDTGLTRGTNTTTCHNVNLTYEQLF